MRGPRRTPAPQGPAALSRPRPGEKLFEEAYDWARPLTDDECLRRNLVGIDVNMAFAAGANGLIVGLGAPTYVKNPVFDPKLPGSWLVDLSHVDLSRVKVGKEWAELDGPMLSSPQDGRAKLPGRVRAHRPLRFGDQGARHALAAPLVDHRETALEAINVTLPSGLVVPDIVVAVVQLLADSFLAAGGTFLGGLFGLVARTGVSAARHAKMGAPLGP